MDKPVAVVLFDGECGLCNGSIRFVLKHESGPDLRFASLGSDAANRLLGGQVDFPDSVIFVTGDQVLTRSDAVMEILRYLKAPWCWGRVLRFVPRGLRDFGYDLIARIRYRIFGRVEHCTIPDARTRSRFLRVNPASRAPRLRR